MRTARVAPIPQIARTRDQPAEPREALSVTLVLVAVIVKRAPPNASQGVPREKDQRYPPRALKTDRAMTWPNDLAKRLRQTTWPNKRAPLRESVLGWPRCAKTIPSLAISSRYKQSRPRIEPLKAVIVACRGNPVEGRKVAAITVNPAMISTCAAPTRPLEQIKRKIVSQDKIPAAFSRRGFFENSER
jgi:hypothetical protein